MEGKCEESADVESEAKRNKNAYVLLVMKGDRYIPGALVAAYSLRLTKTVHDIVCMVTHDVSKDARARLAVVCDQVLEIPYLEAKCKALRTSKQLKLYNDWVDISFTKWQCLGFTQYGKVLFVDADKIVLQNVDHLFSLHAPAGTFASPWADQSMGHDSGHRPMKNPYAALQHGNKVTRQMLHAGFNDDSFVLVSMAACNSVE